MLPHQTPHPINLSTSNIHVLSPPACNYIYIYLHVYGQNMFMDLITTSLPIQEGIPLELPFSTPLPLIFTFLIGQPVNMQICYNTIYLLKMAHILVSLVSFFCAHCLV